MIGILNHIVSEGAIREGKDESFMSSAYLCYMKNTQVWHRSTTNTQKITPAVESSEYRKQHT